MISPGHAGRGIIKGIEEMKFFVVLGFLLTNSILAADGCRYLTHSWNLCKVNQDSKKTSFTVNRPDQSICFLRLVSSTERTYFPPAMMKELNEQVGIRSSLAGTERVKEILFEIRDDDQRRPAIFMSTGKVFGYANTYTMFSKTDESLKSIFTKILRGADTDIVAVQPVFCTSDN